MNKKLYIGNLPYAMDDAALAQVFQAWGEIRSARVMLERETGRSKGFGFVDMETEAQAQAAVAAMHGQELGGRSLVVSLARPQSERLARTEASSGRRARGAGGAEGSTGYAGRRDNGFRSPYSTGPRNRGPYGRKSGPPSGASDE